MVWTLIIAGCILFAVMLMCILRAGRREDDLELQAKALTEYRARKGGDKYETV